jgi:competence protein ComEC
MGGLPAVLRNFTPTELWVGNNPPVPAYLDLLNQAHDLGVRVRMLRVGDTATLGSADVHVLAPLADYRPDSEPNNNDSLVLRVAYKSTSALLEGDAESPIEREMLGEQDLESTLLKVGHHGSTSSTQPDFLARVSPHFAVISCGQHNHYGHPREEVLGALQAAHVRTFSTDINGATCFTLDGKNVETQAFCGLPAQ